MMMMMMIIIIIIIIIIINKYIKTDSTTGLGGTVLLNGHN